MLIQLFWTSKVLAECLGICHMAVCVLGIPGDMVLKAWLRLALLNFQIIAQFFLWDHRLWEAHLVMPWLLGHLCTWDWSWDYLPLKIWDPFRFCLDCWAVWLYVSKRSGICRLLVICLLCSSGLVKSWTSPTGQTRKSLDHSFYGSLLWGLHFSLRIHVSLWVSSLCACSCNWVLSRYCPTGCPEYNKRWMVLAMGDLKGSSRKIAI